MNTYMYKNPDLTDAVNTGSAPFNGLSISGKWFLAILMVVIFALSCDNPADNGNPGDAIYSVEVNEPDRVIEGTNLVFTITRSIDTSNESTLSYSFSGEATYGEDYIDPNNLSVSFDRGQTTAEIILETIEDDETEEEESVILTLTHASDGTFDPNSSESTGYIRDAIPSCIGPEGNTLFINFDDIDKPGSNRIEDGYHGFVWGDFWSRDNINRDPQREPAYGWFDGIVSNPNAIYPSFGAQPGSVSVITRNEPFVLKSFYMSALGINEPLPVTLRYRDNKGNTIGEETFVVSRGQKAFIEPDTDIMYSKCMYTITFNQPVLGASFIIDDMTFIH